MPWEIAQADHIGARLEQQDRSAVFAAPDSPVRLLVVADGMGGHQGGALAAQTVVETARQRWERQADPQALTEPLPFLEGIGLQAHQDIKLFGQRQGLSPHSTCVVLLLHEAMAWWAHVGDSRVYHFRAGQLLKRTRDHSLVQMLVDLGRLREEDMGRHKNQGCLLRGLGGEESCEMEYAQAETSVGDGFVLCSDGLWEQISTQEMGLALQAEDVAQAAHSLAQEAAQRGGSSGDNIAVILARRVAASEGGT